MESSRGKGLLVDDKKGVLIDGYLEISHHPSQSHSPPSAPMSASLSRYLLPKRKKKGGKNFIFFCCCCPYTSWSMVKLLVASPTREDELFSTCTTAIGHRLWRGHSSWRGAGSAQGSQHGFRWQPKPPTSAWPSMITRATDINRAPDIFANPNRLMALSGCIDYGPYHGLRWLHVPLTSTWPLRQQSPRILPRQRLCNLKLHHGLGQ